MSAITERQRRDRLRNAGQRSNLSPYDLTSIRQRRLAFLLIRLRAIPYEGPWSVVGEATAAFAAVSNAMGGLSADGLATMVVTGYSATLAIDSVAAVTFFSAPNETTAFTSVGTASVGFAGDRDVEPA